MSNQKNSPDTMSLYVRGAIIGAALGLVTAMLYRRAVDEAADGEVNDFSLSVGDMIKLAVLLVGVVRQIAELGSERGKDS